MSVFVIEDGICKVPRVISLSAYVITNSNRYFYKVICFIVLW